MNILMVTSRFPPFFAGAAVQAIYLAEQLTKRGFDIQFVTDNYAGRTVDEHYHGLKVHRFSTFSANPSLLKETLYLVRLYWYILTNPRFKIVHFHSIKGYEAFLFPLIKMLGRKIVLKLTLVGVDDPVAFSRRKVGRQILLGLKFVDCFVAISTKLKELALASGIPATKVRLIYNGTNTAKFIRATPEEKQDLKQRFGLERYRFIFCSVGKVEHRKGYDFLLEAWVQISKQFPCSALLIAGPGNESSNPYYQSLIKICSTNGLDNVQFLGHIDNVHDYIRLSDCFVFCSRSEGFGTVLIEAMSSGVPVVATNIPGVTEDIIGDNPLGRIAYSQNAGDFASLVKEVLLSADAETQKSATQLIRTKFSIEQISQTYETLYASPELNSPRKVPVGREP
jgi:L-malate glycosyltransferase